MDQVVTQHLYQPSIMMEIAIMMAVIFSFTKPQFLTALIAALLLLRPNERFECFISYPQVIYPVLGLSLLFFADRENRAKQFRFDKPLIYFILVIVIQTLLFHTVDMASIIEFIAVGILFYYAVVFFSVDPKGAKFLSYSIITSCFIICGEAAYYHYTEAAGSLIWKLFHTGTIEAARLQAWGNWGNANETAFIGCIGIANAVFLCVRYGTSFFYLASGALIPFFALVIFLTGSRAGLATMVLIFLPLVYLLDAKIGKIAVLLVIVTALTFSSSFAPQRVDLKGSSEERFDLRYGGIQLFKQYPIVGVGFKRSNNEFGGMQLHNTYLQALVETGATGALFLFYFLYILGVRIFRISNDNKKVSLSNRNMGVAAGFYIGSLFYFMWGNQLLSLLFFLCLAQIKTWSQLVEQDQFTSISA